MKEVEGDTWGCWRPRRGVLFQLSGLRDRKTVKRLIRLRRRGFLPVSAR